ncbi:MAG TPA: integration host factor [Gammaproteobacteria bacterium]|nr:integration host factor [Gammaproteobacteria bacterium]
MAVKKKAAAKKKTVKKSMKKKTAARKTAPKKKAAAKKKTTTKPAKRIRAIKEPMTRAALVSHLAESTGLSKKEVSSVFEELKNVIEGHLKSGAARVFNLHGLLKIKVHRKPATRARKGINPFTGEEMVFKAKPARNVVKIQALKGLKDMV